MRRETMLAPEQMGLELDRNKWRLEIREALILHRCCQGCTVSALGWERDIWEFGGGMAECSFLCILQEPAWGSQALGVQWKQYMMTTGEAGWDQMIRERFTLRAGNKTPSYGVL